MGIAGGQFQGAGIQAAASAAHNLACKGWRRQAASARTSAQPAVRWCRQQLQADPLPHPTPTPPTPTPNPTLHHHTAERIALEMRCDPSTSPADLTGKQVGPTTSHFL